MAQYRAVVVGCGGRSRGHIRAYEHIPNAEVVACSAPTPTRRDPLAEEFEIAAYADTREMIESERPDIAHLVTWPNTRVELMSLVSELGVPACTVEKPIAEQVTDWRQLVELEAESDTRFAVCHQFRWYPNLVKCQEALNSGRLGEVKFLDLSAGMNISGQGTHTLNYGMSLNGDSPVTRVFGTASGDSEIDTSHPGPDDTTAYLTFENGVRGLWVSGSTAKRCGDPTTVWQHVRVSAYADRGRVNWEEFGEWEVVGADGDERGDYGGHETWVANNVVAQAGFHQAMINWIEDDEKVPGTNLSQSLHEWKVVLALYASAVSRQPVEMAEFDPPEDLFEQLRTHLKR